MFLVCLFKRHALAALRRFAFVTCDSRSSSLCLYPRLDAVDARDCAHCTL